MARSMVGRADAGSRHGTDMTPFSNAQPHRPLTADGLVDRASAFLFAVKEFGDAITLAIRARLGPEYSGNLVVATLAALAHGDASLRWRRHGGAQCVKVAAKRYVFFYLPLHFTRIVLTI